MTSTDFSALQAQIDHVPGFLFPVAAQGTAWLLARQSERGLKGGLLEIGVFHGKYLIVLARSASRNGEAVLGIDNFTYSKQSDVSAAIGSSEESAPARLQILARSSSDVSADEILGALDGPARFVSVDGSHEAEDVHHDLHLADSVLGPDGIIAIDDFLNPRALGVGEATHRFFCGHPDLAPFALFGNKLFVCRPAARYGYAATMRAFFAETALPEGAAYRELNALGRQHVEQTLYGATLLVM